MFLRRRSNVVVGMLTLDLFVPLMMGTGGCPPPTPTPTPTPGATTLVSETDTAPPWADFGPTAVGKTITVRVEGDATGSRITVTVVDPLGNLVVNINNPTSNVSTATFVSTSTGEHFLTAWENGVASSVYTATVTQSP